MGTLFRTGNWWRKRIFHGTISDLFYKLVWFGVKRFAKDKHSFPQFFQIPSHGLLIEKYFLNSTTIRCEPSWKDYLPLNSGSEHSVLLYLNTCWSWYVLTFCFFLPFRSIYSPYDPFLATSLAQVQANGLAAAIQQAQQAGGNHGLDPRLQVIFTAPCILLKPIENMIQRFRMRCQ